MLKKIQHYIIKHNLTESQEINDAKEIDEEHKYNMIPQYSEYRTKPLPQEIGENSDVLSQRKELKEKIDTEYKQLYS